MSLVFQVLRNDFGAIAQALSGDTDRLVREATFNILATSQDLAAVDTGFMKSTGGADVDGDVGTIFYTAEYSPYVEFGTSRMRAQPYLTPAVEMERQRFELGMKALFD